MLFSEFFKIMVNKVTLVGFRGGGPPNRPPPVSASGSTPRRDQARSEMHLLHLSLGRNLGRFPEILASRACLTSLPVGIVDTWPN